MITVKIPIEALVAVSIVVVGLIALISCANIQQTHSHQNHLTACYLGKTDECQQYAKDEPDNLNEYWGAYAQGTGQTLYPRTAR